MKTKLLFIAVAVMALSGCASKEIIKTVYVEKKVPVNSVPQPPKVTKPQYITPLLTQEERKNFGVFLQAVVADSKAKDGYIEILELIINKYKDAADKSELQTQLLVPELDKDAADNQ